MGIEKICRLYNISYQVGLTEPGLPSDLEVINDHCITINTNIGYTDLNKESMV